jgi:hypothetical protein
MSHEKPKSTRNQLIEQAQKMALRYQDQIKNQRDSLTRLLEDPDAVAEIAQLNELLAKAQERIRDLEAHINSSSTTEMEIVTKDVIPDDPAEVKADEVGPPVEWTPPVDLYRPVKTLDTQD